MKEQESVQAEESQWYVLRDLKRPNSQTPAYKVLPEMGVEVFTPMHWVLRDNPKGGKVRQCLPCIPSLLFAKSCKSRLDEIVRKTDTLQYRYVKGAPQNTPMVVPMPDMTRFMNAVSSSGNCIYYSPEEVTPDMIGKEVIIKSGPLEGQVGRLLKLRGLRKKRLIVSLNSLIVAAVEVSPEYIQFV